MRNALKIITYNLFYSSATESLDAILSKEKPDILAVQEIMTKKETLLESIKSPYVLADFSNCHIKHGNLFGIATYYNSKKLKLIKTETLKLSFSFTEFFLLIIRGGNIPRAMLKTVFEDRETKKKIFFYNLHLSPYGGNGIRKKQMNEAFEFLEADVPTIITGDFNFPYMRRDFTSLIKQYDISEATTQIDFSFKKKLLGFVPLKFKLDYILYKNIHHILTKKLDYDSSDHFPLLAEFDLLQKERG